jgi:hypothetical protein
MDEHEDGHDCLLWLRPWVPSSTAGIRLPSRDPLDLALGGDEGVPSSQRVAGVDVDDDPVDDQPRR